MLGDAIRAYRIARGWKQQELSRRSGIRQNHLSMIENNQTPKPSPDTLLRLARAFEITVDALLQAAEDPTPTVDLPPDVGLDEWTAELNDIGRNLTPADRAAVLEHARALRDRRK